MTGRHPTPNPTPVGVTERWMAWGGIVGPAAFATAWIACGLATPGYSPVRGAISDLAAVGASTRVAMTAGFVVFGISVVLYGVVVRRVVTAGAGLAALVCGVATLGVAAVPLGRGTDGLHGLFAGIGYLALTSVPVLMAGPLRRGGRRCLAGVALAAATVGGACLLATTLGPAHGLFQRLGLTTGDAWLVTSAVVILRRGRLA